MNLENTVQITASHHANFTFCIGNFPHLKMREFFEAENIKNSVVFYDSIVSHYDFRVSRGSNNLEYAPRFIEFANNDDKLMFLLLFPEYEQAQDFMFYSHLYSRFNGLIDKMKVPYEKIFFYS